MGVRVNQLTGERERMARRQRARHTRLARDARVLAARPDLPARRRCRRADGAAPLQSVEGLSLGVDLSVRYALDAAKVRAMAKSLPDNIGAEIVEPAVQGVIYKVFARYTVREIFSTKRAEIQQAIENELTPKLAADGIVLRAVQMGKVDLPADYRRGMERPAGRRARHRENALHAGAQGQARQRDRARWRGRESAPRESRRSAGARADHRRQRRRKKR